MLIVKAAGKGDGLNRAVPITAAQPVEDLPHRSSHSHISLPVDWEFGCVPPSS